MSSIPKRRPAARVLAQFVPKAMGEVLAKQGFANGEIVLRWSEIAGSDLASRSRPIKLVWPRKPRSGDEPPGREPATLLVQVESAFALELQMQSATLIDRINRYFGWGCVGALRLKQGPVAGRVPRPAEPRISPEQEARLGILLAGVDDERLADALKRLGRAVSSRSRS